MSYASHTCRANAIFEHIFGCLQNAFKSTFLLGIFNRIFIVTKFSLIEIRNFGYIKYRFCA